MAMKNEKEPGASLQQAGSVAKFEDVDSNSEANMPRFHYMEDEQPAASLEMVPPGMTHVFAGKVPTDDKQAVGHNQENQLDRGLCSDTNCKDM